jgi:UDP-N-acetylglucosamine 2-epimerase (non-hydrolysing)/UDP-GlcNAc:undecaprenyl-phosphate GlcNAc-1-phosphate transferase
MKKKLLKVMIVFGTRPEAIKVAPVILFLKKQPALDIKICITGQHRAMLKQVMELFNIKPDYDLDIMQKDQTLYYITTAVLTKFEEVLTREIPDIVMVHGDTTTSMAASLAAYYKRIPVAHLEAGLRSYDKFNPYPEEINRVLTDSIAEILLAPTQTAKDNLIKENIDENKIFVTGNTVVDALFWVLKNKKHLKSKLKFPVNKHNKLILVTAHRRENFGTPIINICWALKELAVKFDNIEIVYPVHPNPSITKPVHEILGNQERIHLVQPLDYLDFVALMNKSYLILTDSGGLQEEAPSLGKPVLVLRKVTERPEGVLAGTVKIIGTEKEKIVDFVSELLTNRLKYLKMNRAVNPYGDGKASARVYKAIKTYERSFLLP